MDAPLRDVGGQYRWISRGDAAAVPESEHLRIRADPGIDVGPLPDRDDVAVGHRERLRGGLCIVDRANCSLNDQVSDGRGVILSGHKSFLMNLLDRVDSLGLPFDVVARAR
jgi:hypothetical protein